MVYMFAVYFQPFKIISLTLTIQKNVLFPYLLLILSLLETLVDEAYVG